MPKEPTTACELCSGTAAIYCPSDSAYLCWNCDHAVHSANFLVARHHRSTLRDGEEFSGAGRSSSSSSSSCVSSTDGPTTVKSYRDQKVEGVLVNWCRRIGVREYDVVPATLELLRVVTDFVNLRVALATSFWVGLRLCGDTCRDLKAVEKITGVPGGMILAVEKKLKRVLKTRSHVVDDSKEEGWAES